MVNCTFLPRSSRCLLLLLCLLHGLAATAIGLICLSLLFKIPLWIGCAISLGRALSYHHYRNLPTAIVGLHRQADQWGISLNGGLILITEPPEKVFKSPGLV